MPTIEMTNPAALPADWRDLLALTKPRVMSLVVFSGLCGLLAAPRLAPNWLAAALLTASILFYVLVYTVWLKPRTPQNIVIGGAAGAFPPLIGWIAATGHFAALPLLLFAIVFLWTPPHFWALSLFV